MWTCPDAEPLSASGEVPSKHGLSGIGVFASPHWLEPLAECDDACIVFCIVTSHMTDMSHCVDAVRREDPRQPKSKQGFTLSAWYSREIRVSQEASDSFTAQQEQPDSDKDTNSLVTSNQSSADLDARFASAPARKALLMSPHSTEESKRESLSAPVLATQELLRWDLDFVSLSDDKIVSAPVVMCGMAFACAFGSVACSMMMMMMMMHTSKSSMVLE